MSGMTGQMYGPGPISRAWLALAAILLAMFACPAWAAAPAFSPVVEQWGVQEVILRSDLPHDNPFREVTLQAVFKSGGKTIVADGFYDGDQQWKVRLMPGAQGRWRFTTKSNDRQLNGLSGTFTVGAPGAGNHGPVQVAKTWHFSYADGTAYFPLGTTFYNWLNRDNALEERTLATLAKNSFNKVRFGIFPKWYQFNHVEPQLYPYVKTGEKRFDFDRFDPRFFQHIESRLRDLQKLGIEAEIILFHPYDNWGFANMDPARDEAYLRYVTARLSSFHNVWWTMANEYNFFGPQSSGGLRAKDWDGLFKVLQSSDPYRHLSGMHNAGAWYDHSKPWISHVVAQEPSRLTHMVTTGREKYRKPVVIEEYRYEGSAMGWAGDMSGNEEVNSHWEITMAGGYASHGEMYLQPGALPWWSVGGDLVGESPARLGFLKTVMSEAPFQELTPSPDLVMGGEALAKTGAYYLFRFPRFPNDPVQLRTEGTGLYKVDLIDPWLMKVYPLGYTQAGAQAFKVFMAPSLLRFTKVERPEAGLPTGTLTELFATFLKDSAPEPAPALRPFQRDTDYYSIDFTITELLADPRTRAVVQKYMPVWIDQAAKGSPLPGLPARIFYNYKMAPSNETPNTYSSKISAMAGELAQIPVGK